MFLFHQCKPPLNDLQVSCIEIYKVHALQEYCNREAGQGSQLLLREYQLLMWHMQTWMEESQHLVYASTNMENILLLHFLDYTFISNN